MNQNEIQERYTVSGASVNVVTLINTIPRVSLTSSYFKNILISSMIVSPVKKFITYLLGVR
jgi:hypothetical protein